LKKLLLLAVASLLIASVGSATVLISEDFSYADGSLIANPPWFNHSGTAGDLLVASGQAVVQHGIPSEDATHPFTPTGGDLYYAFDFSVDDLGEVISGTDHEYFAHFKDDGFGFRARLDVQAPQGGGDYTVGLSTIGSTGDVTWPADMTYGVVYRVIVRYNQDDNTSQLWIDATLDSDLSISGIDQPDPGIPITGFALRQSDSDLNETVRVDNLIVSGDCADVFGVCGPVVFQDIVAGLTGVVESSAAWGDYDNDGDLDILLTGYTGSARISRVYRNDGGSFVDIVAGLTGVRHGSVAWGDYDNDGDLDILLTGIIETERISRVYRNDGGSFVDIGAGLTGVYSSSVAWGDYDNDGDLDILLTGNTGSELISRVYRNDGGSFVDIVAGLPGVVGVSSAAWGDYDNDGDLDILLTGQAGSAFISRVYRNDGGSFVDIVAGLTGVTNSSVAWGDYDNDGDLDILLTGNASGQISGGISRVYRNDAPTAPNTVPSAPANLSAQLDGSTLTMSWDAATDAETATAGLTYNLRVGTTPGGSEISSAHAAPASGLRLVAQSGNAQQNTSWALDAPAGEIYYWSVQALDASFAGSAFAAEQVYDTVTSVADLLPPMAFALRQNNPNPFNPRTTIRFEMERPAHALLQVFDVAGRLVTTLVNEERSSGTQEVFWQGRDSNGQQVAAGVYFYRLDTGEFSETTRMALVKEGHMSSTLGLVDRQNQPAPFSYYPFPFPAHLLPALGVGVGVGNRARYRLEKKSPG
jgi:hypothetical protein